MLIKPLELTALSWQFYIKNWRKLWIYLLLLLIPVLVITAVGIIMHFARTSIISLPVINFLIIASTLVAAAIFTLWITIALTKTIKNIYKQEPVKEWKENISLNSKYIWPTIITSVMTTLLVVIGTILFIIPGIIFFIWYLFVFYTVVLDDKKGIDALKNSKLLVVGRWWQILWTILVPTVIYGVAVSVIMSIVELPIILIQGEIAKAAINQVVIAVINLLTTTPLMTIAMVALYFSAKENKLGQNAETPPSQTIDS